MFEYFHNITVDNPYPGLIALVALGIFAFFLYRRTFPELSAAKKVFLCASRVILFLLLIIFFINPAVNYVRRVPSDPVIPVLVDISGSMSLTDAEGRSRKETADSILSRIVRAVPEDFREGIEILYFADKLYRSDTAETGGKGTEIYGALKEAIGSYSYKNLAAAILISDGIDTGEGNERFEPGVPVYSLSVGDSSVSTELSIEDIIYSRTVHAGMQADIEAIITSERLGEEDLTVSLYENDNLLDSVTVTGGRSVREHRVKFNYSSAQPGEHTLEIRLNYSGGNFSGRMSENLNLLVLDEINRILYIDRYVDWNTAFIRNLSKKMERYSFDFATYHPVHGYVKIGDYSSWGFPGNPEDLEMYRTIIISDAGMLFSESTASEVLKSYVERGGSVLFLADLNSPLLFDDSYQALEEVLPVSQVSAPEIIEGEYHIAVSQQRPNPVAVAFAESGTEGKLPPLPARIAGYRADADTDIPLYISSEKDGTIPFLYSSECGDGSCGFITALDLWRWKLSGDEGERAYNTLFSSLIQFMAGAEGTGRLDVKSSRNRYGSGEKVRIKVNMAERTLPQGIRGELFSDNGQLIRTFNFNPGYHGGKVYSAVLSSLQPGQYRVAAREILRTGTGLSGETVFAVDSVSVESIRRTADPDFLRDLSARSGGALVGPDKLNELFVDTISLKRRYIDNSTVVPLRSSRVLLVLILIFAGLEWVFRKGWGLV